MDSSVFQAIVAAFFLSLSLIHFLFFRPIRPGAKSNVDPGVKGRDRRQRLHLPPGPKPWPVIGNLLQIGPFPHKSMMEFTRRHGPLVYLKLGVVPTIVTDSPAIIRDILIKQDHIFASRPENIACQYFTYNGRDIAFAPYGQHWRAMRKICTLELLSPRKIASFRDGRCQELNLMVESVFQDLGREDGSSPTTHKINLRDKFASLSCNILTRMLLGKRHFGPGAAGPEDAAEHKQMIYEGFALVNAFNVADYLPFLRAFDLQGHERKMRRIMQRTDEVYDEIIEEHRQKLAKNSGRSCQEQQGASFVDVLLSVPGANGEKQLSTTTIKAIMIDMLSAGTDTSSVISEWAMAELARHPREMAKVREELDAAVGVDRPVDESDVVNLNYLKAVVKEIFRLHPVGAFLIPHFSTEDTRIGGYDIPKNTRILVNTYSLGRSRSVWGDDVHLFRPDRFLASPGDLSSQIVELMDSECRVVPFGAGRRSCPGASLGSCMVVMGLARLIQRFDWSAPPGEEIDVSERVGFTVLDKPLELVAKPRECVNF
ncbi:hypothetical protein SELMODRAFT_108395 [Selaginella moellendorffii]|uniref:Cytochrome P450-dependent monooxygenase n=1 Tax=Selaginella moellendorffii TaxID=88036 RepID=D8S3Z4_SELML|nr:cytochrome P450 703A2 [Selaginella moellendorffii]EFJ20668.1 hypothetical protein SELMODRAFT_108395 [Selaginella moellendorffii]|eukprot:XP_002978011.1 cytochrome P450 703A2 [Selaginella moellendorffii]